MGEDRWKGLVSFVKSPGGAAILSGLAVGLIVLLATGKVTPSQLWSAGPGPQESALTETQVRSALSAVLRQDVIPRLEAQEAGFRALASYQKPEVRVAVLQSMLDARDKATRRARQNGDAEGQP